MEYVYQVISDEVISELGENITVYGVAMLLRESGEVVFALHDIFMERSVAIDFVELCNELELSPDHLYDAAYDYMVKTM